MDNSLSLSLSLSLADPMQAFEIWHPNIDVIESRLPQMLKHIGINLTILGTFLVGSFSFYLCSS